jgi:hypothetical protein
MALQKRALLATATGVVAAFRVPRLLPASASSSPPAGWLSPVATRTPEPLVTAAPSPTSPSVSDALP